MGIKFTEDEKIQFVEDWRTSGLNKKKYAEQNGLEIELPAEMLEAVLEKLSAL